MVKRIVHVYISLDTRILIYILSYSNNLMEIIHVRFKKNVP